MRGVDGKIRHQTPNEAWAQALTEGFEPVEIDAIDRDDLFRPYKTCKIIRGEVRLFNNTYFSHELEDYHGETAQVGYDIHDASRVWVRERTGRLICIAEFEGNKRGYKPESVQDQANYKRMQGRIKRAEAKIIEAQDELNPPRLIEYQPVMELPPMHIGAQPMEINAHEQALTPVSASGNVTPIKERPGFATAIKKYRWLMQNKHTWDADDVMFLHRYIKTHEYLDMLESFAREGQAWAKQDDVRAAELIEQEEEPEDPEMVAAQ